MPGEEIIHSRKELAQNAADMLDSDVSKIGEITATLVRKYATRRATPQNLMALRDEALTRLMEVGILASFDPTPLLEGKSPIVDIICKVDVEKSGLDHEKKGYEINKAHGRGEYFLGEKERLDTRVPKDKPNDTP